jgi:adenylate cyclase
VADYLAQFKQRKLVQWALAYVAAAFALIQVLDIVAQRFRWPEAIIPIVILILGIGFFVTLVLAWYHGERGVQRVSTMELVILAVLLLFGGAMAWRFEQTREGNTDATPSAQMSVNPKAIAVLPFVNMSSDAENGFFADGLSEEILNSLARVDGMAVVGRTSSFQFKGKNEDLRGVGEKLGAGNVLEGSVRPGTDRVRITAQLIRTSDGIHLWSETYDRTLKDSLAVQLDIAEHVAAALNVVLDDTQRKRMHDAGVKNVDAFIAYQKGLVLYQDAHNRQKSLDTIERLRAANVEFEKAIALDQDFSQAHFQAADLFDHILLADDRAQEERAAAQISALQYLERAANTSRDDQQRLLILADRQMISDDWRGLPNQIDAALTHSGCLSPDWLPVFASAFGYGDKIDNLLARVDACDPLNGQNVSSRLAAALQSANGVLALTVSGSAMLRTGRISSHYRVQALLMAGRTQEAASELSRLAADTEGYSTTVAMLGRALHEDDIALSAKLKAVDRSKSILKFWTQSDLAVAAIRGDRVEANRRAALIDAQPAGPFALVVSAAYCLCGAPFDLSATPHLKARLDESGLPWPPKTALPFLVATP